MIHAPEYNNINSPSSSAAYSNVSNSEYFSPGQIFDFRSIEKYLQEILASQKRKEKAWNVLQQWAADISTSVKNLEKQFKVSEPLEAHKQDNLIVMGVLPLTTFDEFVALEKNVKENNDSMKMLVKIFKNTGGRDRRHHINNMMRRLMEDCLARQFSSSGKSKTTEKKAFAGTEICSLIFCACQSSYNTTEEQVKTDVEDWLHQAKTRQERKDKKIKNGTPNETYEENH